MSDQEDDARYARWEEANNKRRLEKLAKSKKAAKQNLEKFNASLSINRAKRIPNGSTGSTHKRGGTSKKRHRRKSRRKNT